MSTKGSGTQVHGAKTSDAKGIETLRENLVYENAYMRVYDNDVAFPSGAKGTYLRTRWTAPHGVAAIPVWQGKCLLMRNYRYSEDAFSVEVPQGFGHEGSTPQEDIQRELSEEIGATATKLTPLGHTGRDYKTYMYLAQMPDDFVYDAKDHESGEAFDDPIIAPIPTDPQAFIEQHGIFDALTQIMVLRLGLLVRDKGLDLV